MPLNMPHELLFRGLPSSCPEMKPKRPRTYLGEQIPLSAEPDASESLHVLAASICRQNGMRVCTCEICHRSSYASLYGDQKICVKVASMGPGLHHCHARDFSAVIDIASRDYEEIGIRGD